MPNDKSRCVNGNAPGCFATTKEMNMPLSEEQLTQLANTSASLAVKKTFAILGVDIGEPSEIEEFRRDLRFSGDMRRYARHGILAFVGTVFVGASALIWKNLTGG